MTYLWKALLIFLVAMISLAACGSDDPPLPKVGPEGTYKIDPAFIPYLDQFLLLYKKPVTSLIMAFDTDTFKLEKDSVGVCHRETQKAPLIAIKRSFWVKATPTTKENLIFHELGHCILNRPHDDRRFTDDRPVSLMNSRLLLDLEYSNNKTYYWNELFNY